MKEIEINVEFYKMKLILKALEGEMFGVMLDSINLILLFVGVAINHKVI